MTFEETFQKMLANEVAKLQKQDEYMPISEFCKKKNISRVTVWRHEKQGLVKLLRIGRKVFINPSQFNRIYLSTDPLSMLTTKKKYDQD